MPSISAIIVNYNSAQLLTAAVSSLLRSEIPVEIYVSDNGSEDNSIELLESSYAGNTKLHIIKNQKNIGFSAGCNIVLPLVSSDYLLFLNPDSQIENDTLKRMIEVMKQYKDVGMAGCLVRNPDGTEQNGCRRQFPTPWRSLMRVLKLSKLFPNNSVFSDFNKSGTSLPDKEIDVDAISGAFMLVKRKAIEDVGLLDEGYFLHCEDLDWCMRFKMAGYRILFVPNIVINHAKGGCSGNRPIFVEWHKHKGMLRFYRKFFLNSYPIFLYPMVVVATWTRFLLKVLYIGLRPNVR